MNNILNEIKELESKAKESEYWKKRYYDLKEQVAIAIKGLGAVQGELNPTISTKKYGTLTSSIEKAVNEAHSKIVNEDAELMMSDLRMILENQGIKVNGANEVAMTKMLKAREHIQVKRVNGLNLCFYCGSKPKLEQQQEAAIKFGKVSIMG